MADIYLQDQPFQGSSNPTMNFDYLATGGTVQGTSQSCIVDLTPPTFAGINALAVQSRGQLRATWLAGSDVTLPIRYEVYVKAVNSTGLFNSANLVAITDKLQYDIFILPDGSFLVNGMDYYVGVKAIDGVGNRDNNAVSLNVISTGLSLSADRYEPKGAFSVNHSNQFQGTLWLLKNLTIAKGTNLTTASYQVYDKAGNAIVGMSATGLTANAEGQFIIPAIPNLLSDALDHYVVKVTIAMDSAIRDGYVPIIEKQPEYNLEGLTSIDTQNRVLASFWVTENEKIVTSGLGTASYQAYAVNGTLMTGFAQTGIVASGNGLFTITPVPIPPGSFMDDTQGYLLKVTVTVNGVTKSDYIKTDPTGGSSYPVAVVSINASNQLEGTLWAVKDGMKADVVTLGTASYTIHDVNGNLVAGLSQTGLVADVNGLYHITPVAATLLTDLTHYIIHVTISIKGRNKSAFYGFSLLGN
jgi:hypothetical protein